MFDDASVGFLLIEIIQIPEIAHVSHFDQFGVPIFEFCLFLAFDLHGLHCGTSSCNSCVFSVLDV